MGLRQRIRILASTPLYLNAYALVANHFASAGLGFVYWLLAARLYPVEVVGRSAAVISALQLIAGLAQLGLGAGMTRFVPRAGTRAPRLILAAYAAVAGAAALLGVGAVVLSRATGLAHDLLTAGIDPLWLVAATVLWALFYFQDGVLTGFGRAAWVLAENSAYNAAKIVLLVLGVSLLPGIGILGSWFLPTLPTVLFVAWLVFARFAPAQRPALGAPPLTAREVVRSVSGDHVGQMVVEATMRGLPLLVVALIGAAANAYFYQAWTVSMIFTLAATAMAASFAAQAAGDRANIASYSRGILRHMLLVIVPPAAAVGLAAPLVLSLFGPRYTQAAPLLRLLVLATPMVAFDIWYFSYERVVGRIARVVALQTLSSAVLIGAGFLGLRWAGLDGVGYAWLASQAVVALAAAPDARRALVPHGEAAGGEGLRPDLADGEWS